MTKYRLNFGVHCHVETLPDGQRFEQDYEAPAIIETNQNLLLVNAAGHAEKFTKVGDPPAYEKLPHLSHAYDVTMRSKQ